eukprot:1159676-Pelagomonas_calceolata.AAC.1
MSVPMADVMEISWAGSHEESEWAYSYARQLLSNDGIRLQLVLEMDYNSYNILAGGHQEAGNSCKSGCGSWGCNSLHFGPQLLALHAASCASTLSLNTAAPPRFLPAPLPVLEPFRRFRRDYYNSKWEAEGVSGHF